MSFLAKVESGIQKRPPFILLYGTPKVGKTSFASKAPNPIIIDIEQGSSNIDVKRLKPRALAEVVGYLKEMSSTEHPFKTVVLDSLDHLEPWIWNSVCARQAKPTASIEDVGGGYAKGYVEALKEWNEIIALLKKCRDEKGMMIICIAHVHTKTVNDPMLISAFDKFELKFHHKASALFKENADAILFAKQEILVSGGEKNKKGKAVGEGKRVLYTQGMPGYEAGNRYNLPAEMEFDFDKVYALINEDKKEANPDDLINQIKALAGLMPEELKMKALAAMDKANKNSEMLEKVYRHILKIQGGK